MNTDVAVMPTTLVAVTGEDYHTATASLADWLRAKLGQMQVEIGEVDRAEVAARSRDFRPEVYGRMRTRLNASAVWYEKLLAGIEKGYTIMPDLPMRLFAIRTTRKRPPKVANTERGQRYEWGLRRAELAGQALPVGEGEYVSATAQREVTDSYTETDDKGKTVGIMTFANTAHAAVALPIALMKPELVEAIGKAVEQKLFDEIGICESSRVGGRGDPLVMGRIYRDGRRQKAVCFVIGWYVQVRDLL